MKSKTLYEVLRSTKDVFKLTFDIKIPKIMYFFVWIQLWCYFWLKFYNECMTYSLINMFWPNYIFASTHYIFALSHYICITIWKITPKWNTMSQHKFNRKWEEAKILRVESYQDHYVNLPWKGQKSSLIKVLLTILCKDYFPSWLFCALTILCADYFPDTGRHHITGICQPFVSGIILIAYFDTKTSIFHSSLTGVEHSTPSE